MSRKKLTLDRLITTASSVFGRLSIHDEDGVHMVGYTLEPAPGGKYGEGSCIAPGVYSLEPTWFNKKSHDTYEVVGVDGRDRVLFHVGNYASDTRGCILVGLAFTAADKSACVYNSRRCFRRFMLLMDGEAGEIVVTTPPADSAIRYALREAQSK